MEEWVMEKRLEYMAAGDRLHDFCLWEYAPVAPCESKLRSSSLLFHSFDLTGIDGRAFGLVEAIRAGFGTSNSVWGVKKLGNDILWEFYFYDYRQAQRGRSIASFLDIVEPFAACELPACDDLPYFMFSVDIDERLLSGARDLDEVHVYIGNTGSTVSSGIAYSVRKERTRLENFYFFFDAKEEMEKIVGKTACSAYLRSAEMDISQILWPELCDCSVIVVANKQTNDSVYFSRINVDQFVFFLERMGYPEEIRRFVQAHRSELDHMLYDVGFDYRVEGNDVVVVKSGYYGIF